MALKASDYVDLDNFVFNTLNRAPKLGDEIVHNNFKITMEDVQGKKVIRAKIVKV